jgi:UDP-N-acetylmuramate dehydrogenase
MAKARKSAEQEGTSGKKDQFNAIVEKLPAEVRGKLQAICPGRVLWDEPLADYSTLRVGGPAWAVVKPEREEEFAALVKMLTAEGVRWWLIGRGSNILVPDSGLSGVVVLMGRQYSRIEGPRVMEKIGNLENPGSGKSYTVSVQAGCSLSRLLHWAVEHALSGLEFVAGIPGSVGGAIRMNAGAWGREMADCVYRVRVMDEGGEFYTLDRRRMGFGYRHAAGVRDKIVLSADLHLQKGDRELIEETCQEIVQQRLGKQPLQSASAGSFFKNPVNHAAGRIIEQAGLKGSRCGGAMVSEKHANFIVNTGGATASDIYELMKTVQSRVVTLTGIMLEPEVQLLGEWPGEKRGE